MKFSLRLKLIGFTFCIVLLVGGTISLYTILQGRQWMLADFEKEARGTAAVIAGTIANDLHHLNLRSLRLRLENARVNSTVEYTYVMDVTGVVLSDGTVENPLRDQSLVDAFSRRIPGATDWILSREKGKLRVGGPVLLADGRPVGYLEVGFSLAQIQQAIHLATRSSLHVTLVCLGLGALLAFLLSESVSRPIAALAHAAREIGHGKLETRVASKRGDEIGVLAESINQMALNLSQITVSRSYVETTIKEITRELDLGVLLDLITQRAVELVGADAGVIFLWEAQAEVLVPRAWRGLGQWIERVRLRKGEAVAGTVAQRCVGLIVNDFPSSPSAYPLSVEHGIKAVLGEPLLYRECLLGVITVSHQRPAKTFTEPDRELLSLFAAQAAIAIENASLYDAVQRHAVDLEAHVSKRTADLEEALRIKAQFLANMSHELRTPLNAVLGFSEVLLTRVPGPLTPKQERYLQLIYDGGQRLLALVADLLEMGAAGSGRPALQLDRVAAADVVGEVLGGLAPAARAKQVVLITSLDPGLPFLVGDRRKLVQILHHLVLNAIRFTPAGGRVAVESRQVGVPEDEAVELTVTDTGMGIRPEDLERIFLPFEQVDGSDTRRHGGAGLGLALVRRVVELHGGRVWAESAGEGQGARFVVRLPRLESPRAKRILVVEDDAAVLESLCDGLEGAGYAAEAASTGTQALAALTASPPDLLLLDIGLPDVDGWAVLRRVRAEPRTHELPVLVLTGLDYVHADQALALGADEFLTKPISVRVLVEIVTNILARPPAVRAAGVWGEPPPIEG